MPAPAGGAAAPGSPLFPVAGRKPRRKKDIAKAAQAPAPKRQPPPLAKKGYVPKRKRRGMQSSGVTQTIDINDLKQELGITGESKQQADAAPPAEGEVVAVPTDARQKEIALRAFIKRVLPSTLHQVCLETVLKKRLTVVSPTRLSEETGCKEREARRILEDWRKGGLAKQEDPTVFQYAFMPPKADLALIREFLVLWSDPTWHNRLLGWILEVQG
jgi:hypothetical protein